MDRGKGFTSAYLIRGKKLALIDCGPTSSADALLAGLQELRIDPSDLAYIIVTHIHFFPMKIHQVLPSHKTMLTDCRGRINQLKEHHFSRLEEIWQILKNKSPLNAYEVAARMTWDMKGKWIDFPVQQKWFAHGEAIAHIKYLEREGRIVPCGEEENSIRWAVNPRF